MTSSWLTGNTLETLKCHDSFEDALHVYAKMWERVVPWNRWQADSKIISEGAFPEIYDPRRFANPFVERSLWP